MSTFDYQRLIARLIVDEQFYKYFTRDPVQAAASLGVDPTDQDRLAEFDRTRLEVFREVVIGTRSVRFELIFDSLRDRMSQDEWKALLEAFHHDVVVKNSDNGADLDAFCGWLDEEFPGSAGAALARYQRTVQRIGAEPPPRGASGRMLTDMGVCVFCCGFDLDELLSTSPADLWTIGRADALRHYVVKASIQDGDLEVLEVTELVTAILGFLRRPRTAEKLLQRLGGDRQRFDELVTGLRDAGLIAAM